MAWFLAKRYSYLFIILIFAVFLWSLSFIYQTKSPDNKNSISEIHSLLSDYNNMMAKLESKLIELENPNRSELKNKNPDEQKIHKRSYLSLEKPLFNEIEYHTEKWYRTFIQKLSCLNSHRGLVYLYHVRKAAGTTLRDLINDANNYWKVPFFETEGKVLIPSILDTNGLLSATTLRDPINRIVSLYWYEHVGWFDGILKQTHRCKSFREWVNGWKDGSNWKNEFIKKFPENNYVEIDNYYVKIFSGWKSAIGKKVTGKDLEIAKQVLQNFDVIFITEWFSQISQVQAIKSIFPGIQENKVSHKVKGDPNVKKKLKDRLAEDEDEILLELRKMNRFDIELFEYAKELVAKRLLLMKDLSPRSIGEELNLRTQCPSSQAATSIKSQYGSIFGIFQPAGHKGPF